MTSCVDKQHQKGKLFATERIELLFDADTFVELFTEEERDGVFVGKGKIFGREVYTFCQDYTYKGGSIGLQHGKRIARLIALALEKKRPIVGIYDSGGARIEEGVDGLAGSAEMLCQTTLASGKIPQISVVLGPCAGASCYAPAISDIIFSVPHVGCMFITGPDVVREMTGEGVSFEELGGVEMHERTAGVIQCVCPTEQTCFERVRTFFSYLYNDEKKDIRKKPTVLKGLSGISDKTSYDMHGIIEDIVDEGTFWEWQEHFADNLLIGLGKIGGRTVGIVANQPQRKYGTLDCDSACKGGRFVRFCNLFSLPILTLVDTPGYLPGKAEEEKGIIRHGAKLLFAYAEATTLTETIILRKAYGGAYIALGSKPLGTSHVYVLEGCKVGVMGIESATRILYKKEYDRLSEEGRKDFWTKKEKELQKNVLNGEGMVQKGYAERVLLPEEIRETIVSDIDAWKKRKPLSCGNIPL